MIKSAIIALGLLFIVPAGWGQQKKDYAEIIEYMNYSIKYYEDQLSLLESVKNAKEAGQVIVKIEKSFPEMSKKTDEFFGLIKTKYPELNATKEPPLELKPLSDKLLKITEKTTNLMFEVIKKYQNNPEFSKAKNQ